MFSAVAFSVSTVIGECNYLQKNVKESGAKVGVNK